MAATPHDPHEALTAILVPKAFQEAMLTVGAEYVEVRSASTTAVQQRLVIIPDEEERRRQLERQDAPDAVKALHSRKLAELGWARDKVLADPRIQAFLPSQEASLWPNVDSLRPVVSMVSFLKEHDDTPRDPQGARSMMRAMRVLENESSFPGVYTLREVPLEGVLELYDVTETTELVPGSSIAGKDEAVVAANSLPSQLRRRPSTSAAPKPFLLDTSGTSRMSALDAVEERLTPAAHIALLQHLGSSPADAVPTSLPPQTARQRWGEVIQAHRESVLNNGASLFMDVQEALRAFGLDEPSLASLMRSGATPQNHHVRLRVGASATIVQLPTITCVLIGKRSDELTEKEVAALVSAQGDSKLIHTLSCAATDAVFAGSNERVQAIMKASFASPLLAGLAGHASLILDSVTPVGPLVVVVRARTPATNGLNPFVVVHGSRVENGFLGDSEVAERVKRQRQEVMDQMADELRLDALRGVSKTSHQQAPASSNAPTAPSASVSRDIRAQIHSTVVQVLSTADRPLSKKEISQQASMAVVRQHPSFDRLLTEALGELAETISRKYVLKQ